MSNGYSISQINKVFCSTYNHKSNNSSSLSSPLALISLPYIQGTTYCISKIIAKKNIKIVFKPYKTLNQWFRFAKDKTNLMLNPGVYQIPCSCGKSYIVQAGRYFEARLQEHIFDTTHNHTSKYVIVEHPFNSKHLICFDQTKILASAPQYTSCIIREDLQIEKHPNNFNWKDDYKLSHLWKPIIHCLKHITQFDSLFLFFSLSPTLFYCFSPHLLISFYNWLIILILL